MPETLRVILTVLLAGILTDNYVLVQTTGICPFLGVSKKFQQAAGMGIAVIFVMLCATAVTWPIYTYLLAKFNMVYLQTIVFILVIAALVQFVEIVLKKFIPALYKSLGVYLPLITTNCAVLGIAEENIEKGRDFLTSMSASFGVGVGFLFAMILFAGVRSRIENCPSPKPVKGLPITLIAAAIVAMAFYGFGGIARLGYGMLPSEYVIAEHYRLGSTAAILSRSFANVNKIEDTEEIDRLFCIEAAKIREYEKSLGEYTEADFEKNRLATIRIVGEICEKIGG